MRSPLAVVLDVDATIREETRRALVRAGVEVVAVATPQQAASVLWAHPHAVVVAAPKGANESALATELALLCQLRADGPTTSGAAQIQGRSEASATLLRRLRDLAASQTPVLFSGEPGSGRAHAARCLHALSNAPGPFLVIPADKSDALHAALSDGEGCVFVPSIENLGWKAQERIGAFPSGTGRVRLMASISIDPDKAVAEGRVAPTLLAGLLGGIVLVPALRQRTADISILAQAFVDELCRLNGLPPIVIAAEAMAALERYPWPGNVLQLRSAIEACVTLAQDGRVRLNDLPEYVRDVHGPSGRADRRFREAKRTVVDAFERSYLDDLLRRHDGNVTGAAEQSGMLRSALQRLLRKHDLHSADFRRRGGPNRYAS